MLIFLLACGGLQTLDLNESDTAIPGPGTGEPRVSQDLTGMTYRIDWSDVEVVEPPGFGPVLAAMELGPVLVHVDAQQSETLRLSLALGAEDGGQSQCEPVQSLPAAQWLNPLFRVDAAGVNLTVGGRLVQFRELKLEGELEADASAWRDGAFELGLDTRQLSRVLGDDVDACEVIEAAQGECVPCPDGEVACATLRLESIHAVATELAFDSTVDGSGC